MGKRKPHPAGRPPEKTVDAEGEQEQGTIFFYMPNEKPYGIFCQWHTSPFSIPTASLQWLVAMAPPPPTHPSSTPTPSAILSTHATTSSNLSIYFSNSSITFTCAEQSYMFCKALYFSDFATARLILSTPDPKTQKKQGQSVKNFNFYQWGKVKGRVARVGNWYKFTGGGNGGKGNEKGNKHMRDALLGTQRREIAEASRKDRVWGIGYKADEAELYREFWGENLLGRCLMDVRNRIIEVDRSVKEGEVVDWEWDGALGGEGEGDGEEVVEDWGAAPAGVPEV